MEKSMTVRLLSVFLTVLIGFGFPTDCFCSGSGSSQYVSKYLYNLYKKIPVVCWHKEWDERFELEIEASFISPAETMNIYTSKAGISGNDTLFTYADIRGKEYPLIHYSYGLDYSLDNAAKRDSMNRRTSEVRKLMLNTDSIFIVRIMDDEGIYDTVYQYFGVKRNGHYEYGRTDFGPDTWTFPEMIEKAFGSMENFRKQYLEYVERVLYGRPKPVPEVPDDGKLHISD